MPVGSAADKQEKLVRQLQQQEANKRCINCKSVRYSIMCVSILLALWWTEGRARVRVCIMMMKRSCRMKRRAFY